MFHDQRMTSFVGGHLLPFGIVLFAPVTWSERRQYSLIIDNNCNFCAKFITIILKTIYYTIWIRFKKDADLLITEYVKNPDAHNDSQLCLLMLTISSLCVYLNTYVHVQTSHPQSIHSYNLPLHADRPALANLTTARYSLSHLLCL